MKEIGQHFKETREKIGISIVEVANDLKVEESEIENIEDGNLKAFSNVISLKSLIHDYSKYLGLNAEDMLDEYNEYLFDCTSKISLADIKAAKKRISETDGKKMAVKSPYTKKKKTKNIQKYWMLGIVIIFLCIIFIMIICFMNRPNSDIEDQKITDVIR